MRNKAISIINKIKQNIMIFIKKGDHNLTKHAYARKNIILMYHNYHTPSKSHIEKLSRIAVDFDIVVANCETIAMKAAPSAEIIFGYRYLRQCLPHAKNLRWVQSSSGGVDQLPTEDLRQRRILLSRTTFASKPIARHAYTLAWSIIRRLPVYFSFQVQRKWHQIKDDDFLPYPKRALILGFGCIGKEIGKLLKNDGIEVYGVKRIQDKESKKLCDRLIDTHSWRNILPKIDLCFLTLPLNKYTIGLFDESALASLPKHAILINVSRGDILDEITLFRLLRERRLGGAGLDVLRSFSKYNSQIWKVPNLIITPHVAARSPEYTKKIEAFFEDQLLRYLKNGRIENVVNFNAV